ncbi:UNVERIFIED_CONTAM: hypothetical protein RMT77_005115 [Armadillidium vulgare]
MALNCGATFVKYLLCFFNFLLFILGGALLAVSIWVAIDNTSFFLLTRITDNIRIQDYNESTVLETGAYILIAAGGIVFLLGFLGCCGAAMESRPLLVTYGILIILVFLLEVTAGVLIAIYKKEMENHLEDFLKVTLRKHYTHQTEPNSISVTWDAMMTQMHCCGINNFTDFELAHRWQRENESDYIVPRACCILQTEALEVQEGVRAQGSGPFAYPLLDDSCLYNPTENNSYHLIGCLRRLQAAAFYYMLPCISVAVGLGGLELIVITLSMYLCRAISVTRNPNYPIPYIISDQFFTSNSSLSESSSINNPAATTTTSTVYAAYPMTSQKNYQEQNKTYNPAKHSILKSEDQNALNSTNFASYSAAQTLASNAVLKTNNQNDIKEQNSFKSPKQTSSRFYQNFNSHTTTLPFPHTNFSDP